MILFSKSVVSKIDELCWYPQHEHPISSTKNPSLSEEKQGQGVREHRIFFTQTWERRGDVEAGRGRVPSRLVLKFPDLLSQMF